MSSLELKVPPDLVALVTAAAMWIVSAMTPHLLVWAPSLIWAAVGLAVAGIWIIIDARVRLGLAHTTWSPITPGHTTSLVTAGAYRFSRNPMYLGMLTILVAWAFALASPLAVLVSAVFLLYMDRFQIAPEERTLVGLLGDDYRDYVGHVRRWI